MRRTLACLVFTAAIAVVFQPTDAVSADPTRLGSEAADVRQQPAEATGADADLGVHARAEREYRGLIFVDPNNAEAWLGLARVQSWQSSFDESAYSYSRYHELAPEDATALAEYARVLSYRGDYPRALDRIEDYRELAGETPEYRRIKTNILAWADRPDAALEVARVGLESEPDDAELICSQAVALNQAREFRRSLERLDACAEREPSGVDVDTLREILSTSLKPLGIRGIRHRLPYRPDYDWEPAYLLGPTAMADVHYRGDTEHIHTVESGVAGWVPINPELFVGGTAGYEHLWADRDRYETKGGDDSIGYAFATADLEARLVENVWLGARLGADVTTAGKASTRYRIALDARPLDALEIAVVQEQRLFSYSPRTVSRGTRVNRTHLLARWAPDLRWVVESGGGYDVLSDDNRRWHAFVAPRRAVLRRQRLAIDLGVRGEWWGFRNQRFGTGYYDPDFYQRYVGTVNLRSTPREKLTLSVYAAAGVAKDEDIDGVEPAGDLFAEAIFGAYDGWLFKLRAGVTATTREGDNYTGWIGGFRLIRRF